MNALILIIANKNKDISYCVMCGKYMYNSDIKIVPVSYLRRAQTCQICFLKTASYIQGKIDRNGRLEAQMDVAKCKWCGGNVFDNSNSNISPGFLFSQSTCARCQVARWKCNEERAKKGKYYKLSAHVGGMMDDQQLMGDRVVERQQITTFAEDEEQIVHIKDEISTAPKWNNHVQDSMHHDIVNILKRPIRITGGNLTPIFPFPGLPMPDTLFANSENLRNKVQYFGFMRANLKFKILFNATPFMSGKYLMWFDPMSGYSNRPLAPTLASKTGFPCVELDIAKGSSVELKVPYCAPLSHYNLTNGQSYMGKLYIDVITGTLEGAAPSLGPSYSLYAWFEDIELSMPTTYPGITFPTPPADTLFAQIAVEESVQLAKPKLSAISGGVSTTARLFANLVPRWSGILRPVEWISRAVAGAASSFGMNKPTDLRPGAPMFNLPAKGFTNMDGDDGGVILGAAPDNSLTMPSGLFSTDVDEMDLGYVTKNACICSNEISWSTTQAVNSILYTFPVHPGLCEIADPDIYPTTLAFVSSMFERWTGGLRYRLAVSKTAFHSGRLRITFHPSYFDTTLATSEQQNGYNWVLDLSVSSDIDFVIPYVSNTQWKDVRLGRTDVNVRNVDVSSGMVSITVLTKLVAASATVASTAPMYLWISAAEDFSLAIPSNPRYCPKSYDPVIFVDVEDVDEPDTLLAQIWNETSTDSKINQEQVDISQNLFPKAPIHPTFPEQVCIGEKIVNLRQIIKRFCKTAEGNSSPYPNPAGTAYSFPGPIPNAFGSPNTVNAIGIDPAYFGTNVAIYTNSRAPATQTKYFTSGGGDTQTLIAQDAVVSETFQSQALLHYLSYLYTFWTGSKRYKVFFSKNASQSADVLARPRTQIPFRVYRDTDVVNNGVVNPPQAFKDLVEMNRIDARFESVVYPDLDGCIEFTVPYYSKFPISLITQGTINSNRGTLVSRNLVAVNVGFNSQDSVSPHFDTVGSNIYPTYVGKINEDVGAFTLYEAAGDDFSFGYLRGAPVLQNTRAFT